MTEIRRKIKSIEPKFDESAIENDPRTPPAGSSNSPAAEARAITGPSDDADPSRWIFWTSLIMAIMWIAAIIFIIMGYFQLGATWSTLSPAYMAGLVMLVFGPALLLLTTGYALKQLNSMARDGRAMSYAAQMLTRPDMAASEKANALAARVRTELDRIDARLEDSLSKLGSLHDTLESHSNKLKTAGVTATEQTARMANSLSNQRDAMAELTHTFDKRIAAVSAMLETHAETLSKQQALAEQKVQEARIGVETAAEKINAASDTVRSNTLQAAAALSGSHQDIQSLGEIIRTRSEELDATYTKHANALTAMIENLRSEQNTLSGTLEERLAAMRDMSLSAKVSAESLTAASSAGKDTVAALAESASLANTAIKQRFAEIEDMVRVSNLRAETLNEKAVRRVNESLANTRGEISRIEQDMARLQENLNSGLGATSREALEFVEETPKQTRPDTEATPRRSRRKRIRLKPLDDDFPPVEAPDVLAVIPRQNSEPDPLALDIEPADLDVTSDDNEILSYQPPDITPRATSEKPEKKGFLGLFGNKSKPDDGFRWRDMLTSIDDDAPAPSRLVSGKAIITSLTQNGFSPDVMVDDGCVIEAANVRVSKDASAMSDAVAYRLSLPVRHLSEALDKDPAFRTDAMTFVQGFSAQVQRYDGDREGIRTLLETPNGRAFLLCDAALNGAS